MQKTQAKLAKCGGDTWFGTRRMLALWPWPPIVIGMRPSRFTEDDYRCFEKLLRPGDFILSRSEAFKLSNFAIGHHGTAFIHLAVYTGCVKGAKDFETGFIDKPVAFDPKASPFDANIHQHTITHAISEGVVTQDLLQIFGHVDMAAIVRPWSSPVRGRMIVDAALERVGQPYNFDFTAEGPEATYCTELGHFCCHRAGIQSPRRHLIPVTIFGRFGAKAPVTLADSFVESFHLIASSLSCNDRSFWSNSFLGDRMRRHIQKSIDARSYRA